MIEKRSVEIMVSSDAFCRATIKCKIHFKVTIAEVLGLLITSRIKGLIHKALCPDFEIPKSNYCWGFVLGHGWSLFLRQRVEAVIHSTTHRASRKILPNGAWGTKGGSNG